MLNVLLCQFQVCRGNIISVDLCKQSRQSPGHATKPAAIFNTGLRSGIREVMPIQNGLDDLCFDVTALPKMVERTLGLMLSGNKFL